MQNVCMRKGDMIHSGFVLILDRLNPSQNHLHQRQKWEQNVAIIRSNLVGLKVRGGANIGGLQVKGVSSFSHSVLLFFIHRISLMKIINSCREVNSWTVCLQSRSHIFHQCLQ